MDRHVLVDLGEIRDLTYYTGVVFEVLVPDLGVELGGGGRYDDLVGRFGHPMRAVGFALDVERVLEAMARAGVALPSGTLAYRVEGPEAHGAAAALRIRGLSVAVGPGGGEATVVRAEGGALFKVADGVREATDLETLVREAGGGAR